MRLKQHSWACLCLVVFWLSLPATALADDQAAELPEPAPLVQDFDVQDASRRARGLNRYQFGRNLTIGGAVATGVTGLGTLGFASANADDCSLGCGVAIVFGGLATGTGVVLTLAGVPIAAVGLRRADPELRFTGLYLAAAGPVVGLVGSFVVYSFGAGSTLDPNYFATRDRQRAVLFAGLGLVPVGLVVQAIANGRSYRNMQQNVGLSFLGPTVVSMSPGLAVAQRF